MRNRLFFYSGLAILTILVFVIVWQGSFTFGPLAPSSVEQTYIFWAVSTVIFILTVMLGFLLFNYPVLALFNRATLIFGIPLGYAFIFVAWALLIGLMALVVRHAGR